MTAGLPGTGIGSIFYFLLTLLMPVHEFIRLCRGKSDWSRWRFIGRQWSMLAGMIGGMWAWSWLVNQFIIKCLQGYAYLSGRSVEELILSLFLRQTGALLYLSAFGAMISLTAVLIAVFTTRAILRWQRARQIIVVATSRPLAGLKPTLAPTGSLREPVSSSV